MQKKMIKGTAIFIFCCLVNLSAAGAESIQERFKGEDKLAYQVYFNGVSVGEINWRYLGKGTVDNKAVDILEISSDTAILKLLNLQTKEKVFLEADGHLPVKVERDVVLFGKEEHIDEIYNQEKGYVKIAKRNFKAKEKVYYPDKPIHNILALLYFFPKDLGLESGKELIFNLPTHKVKIKVLSSQKLPLRKGTRKTYLLSGKGKKKFRIWLDQEERLPLRLEFITLMGKISIVKRD